MAAYGICGRQHNIRGLWERRRALRRGNQRHGAGLVLVYAVNHRHNRFTGYDSEYSRAEPDGGLMKGRNLEREQRSESSRLRILEKKKLG